MSSRAELINRVNGSEASPFLLCNLLGRRARQLATGQHAALIPELINVALREFLGGSLNYEANGARPHSAAVVAAAGAAVNEMGAARKAR
jgi:DNA-directed RNA polymerase subunit K/omega